jgi:hypothetical protein
MRSVLLLALVTGCFGEPEYDLDDVHSELVMWAGVNVGAPDALVSMTHPLFVSFDDPDMGCFFLDSSAHVLLDGVRGGTTVIEGKTHAGCDGVALYVDQLPAPRDTSEIALVDDSARLVIRVPQLLVNPMLEVAAPLQRGGTATIRVLDPRPISYASISWKPDDPNAQEWGHYNPDLTTAGEVRFPVPTTAVLGPGMLRVSVTISHYSASDASLCPDLRSCVIDSYGGATFPLSIQ